MMLDALDAWDHHAAEPDRPSAAALDLLAAAEEAGASVPAPLWHRFLDATRRPRFLSLSRLARPPAGPKRVRRHPGLALHARRGAGPAGARAPWPDPLPGVALARRGPLELRSGVGEAGADRGRLSPQPQGTAARRRPHGEPPRRRLCGSRVPRARHPRRSRQPGNGSRRPRLDPGRLWRRRRGRDGRPSAREKGRPGRRPT
jgi:hypothetical protein